MFFSHTLFAKIDHKKRGHSPFNTTCLTFLLQEFKTNIYQVDLVNNEWAVFYANLSQTAPLISFAFFTLKFEKTPKR